MKSILMAIALLAVPYTTVFSQQPSIPKVTKFRAKQMNVTNPDGTWATPVDNSTLIVIKGDHITVYGSLQMDIDMFGEMQDRFTPKGIHCYEQWGIDQFGLKCKVSMYFIDPADVNHQLIAFVYDYNHGINYTGYYVDE